MQLQTGWFSTTAAIPENPVTKKGRDWLLSDFLFGTEIGEGQLKKPPCKEGGGPLNNL